MSYGVKLNMALTKDERGVNGGLHITDSDGLDISSEYDGLSIMSVVTSLAQDAADLIKEATSAPVTPDTLNTPEPKECHCDDCGCGCSSVPFSAAEVHEVSKINGSDETEEFSIEHYIETFAEIIKEEAYAGEFSALVYTAFLDDDEDVPNAAEEAIDHFLNAGFSLEDSTQIFSDGTALVEYTLHW